MLNIYRKGNSLVVEGLKNEFYPFNDVLTYPLNTIVLTIDKSDIAVFKSASTNDVHFSARIDEITINDERMTKDTILDTFSIAAYSTNSGGGGEGGAVSSVNGQTGDVMITASSINAYTKAQTDALIPDVSIYTTKEESEAIEAKIPSLEGYATEAWVEGKNYLTTHQDISGLATKQELENVENKIPDVSDFVKSEDLPTDFYTKGETDSKLLTKQDVLVSGTNIKTVNGKSLLGEGDIEIQGGSADLSNYYTMQEVDDLIPDTSEFLSVMDAETNYQKKLHQENGLESYDGLIATVDNQTLFQANVKSSSFESINPLLLDVNGSYFAGDKFNITYKYEKATTSIENNVYEYCLFNVPALEQYIKDNIDYYINYFKWNTDPDAEHTVYTPSLVSVNGSIGNNFKTYILEWDYDGGEADYNGYEDFDENGNLLYAYYQASGKYNYRYRTSKIENGDWELSINYDGMEYDVRLHINYNHIDSLSNTFTIRPSESSKNLLCIGYPQSDFSYRGVDYSRTPLEDRQFLYYYNPVDYRNYVEIPKYNDYLIDGRHVPSKQDTLESGVNIKTINGTSLLGEGDLVITGGGGSIDMSAYYTKTEIDAMIGTLASGLDIINGEEV